MIDLYYWPTPNGWKVSIVLEELALPYTPHIVNINKGDQFAPAFLKISPNNRMPAIVDHDVPGDPVPVFESGAILLYLARKTGRLMPQDPLGEKECLEWLFWQAGNLGPMGGQTSHFINYAPGDHPYARDRYANEYNRCLGVLDKRLGDRRYLLGDEYSIADIMSFPWVLIARHMHQPLDAFPHLNRWRAEIKGRPAVQRGVDLAKDDRRRKTPTEEEFQLLFQQTAGSVRQQARTGEG